MERRQRLLQRAAASWPAARGSRGWRSRAPARRWRATCAALRSPSSRAACGLDDVVDPGRAAADVLLGRLDDLEPGDPRAATCARTSGSRCAWRRWQESWSATRRVSGCRGARGSTSSRNSPTSRTRAENAAARSAQAGSSPSSQPSSFRCEPQPEALTTTSSTSRSNASISRRANALPSSSRPAWTRERPAAALRRRDDLVAVGREHARGRGVDGAEHGGLDAACEHADASARLAARGRQCRGALGRAPRRRDLRRAAAARAAAGAPAGAPRGASATPIRLRVGEQLEEQRRARAVRRAASELALDRVARRPRSAGRT